MRELIVGLKIRVRVPFVVDQPASIGALPLGGDDESVPVDYLPGLAMQRVAALHPGEAVTDARGAVIIAHAARSMLYALRSLRGAEVVMLCGLCDDLAEQINWVSHRVRGLLPQIHSEVNPGLSR